MAAGGYPKVRVWSELRGKLGRAFHSRMNPSVLSQLASQWGKINGATSTHIYMVTVGGRG